MPDDPSGTYSLPEAAFTAGTVAESARVNNNLSDIATALTDRVTRDGAGSMSGNLAMGSNRITGLSVGTARTDAASVSQLQDGGALWGGTAGGSADARTITLSPAITAYAAGQRFAFVNGAAANTGAATLNVNSVGAVAIRKGDGSTALAAGDLPASALITVQHDGTVFRLISATYTAAQGLAALGGATAGAATASGLTMATARLLGRTTASTGAVEEISVGAGLTLTGGTLAAPVDSDRQVFNASGTWTKPAGFPTTAIVLLQAWGGGGSGRRDNGAITNCAGGGGGGYSYRWVTLTDMGATETITVGAGGAARSGSNQNGAAGGNSTAGTLLTAYGGGGGGLTTSFGGGGGMAGAGSSGAVGSVHGAPYGGGNGGYDNAGAVAATPSGWGGGGGGGGASGAAGGASVFGGAGGAAGSTATGVAGTQPGGGGGGATSTSGAGGDGRVIITVFR